MPPSPALRFSPARQLRTQKHRRGRSLEGGLKLKERDDSLALFNDIQARKGESFLLQSIDDLDESLCRFQNYLIFSKLLVFISVYGRYFIAPNDPPLFSFSFLHILFFLVFKGSEIEIFPRLQAWYFCSISKRE